VPQVGLEHTIAVLDREKTVHAIDCTATVIGAIGRCDTILGRHEKHEEDNRPKKDILSNFKILFLFARSIFSVT
jgi:hypothetical protein